MPFRNGNIHTPLSVSPGAEASETLYSTRGFRVDRIASRDHSSPADFWYDQPDDEWVIVVEGNATLEIEGSGSITLRRGDWIAIPAHTRHRIERTDSATVWLAVHAHQTFTP